MKKNMTEEERQKRIDELEAIAEARGGEMTHEELREYISLCPDAQYDDENVVIKRQAKRKMFIDAHKPVAPKGW